MLRTTLVALALAFAVMLLDCGPTKTPPSLTLRATPNSIDGVGQVSTISITALDEADKAGTGSVTLTSMAGSLKTAGMVTLDVNGYGETPFHCELATDMDCHGSVQVKGVWSRPGKDEAVGYATVTVGASSGGGGGGGGAGGVGGGGGAGGGFGSMRKCAQMGEYPGLKATCCQNFDFSPGVVGPACNEFGVVNNEVFMAPFVSGTQQLLLPLRFTVGTGYPSYAACGSFASGFVVDLTAYDGGFVGLAGICGQGTISGTGEWTVSSAGYTCGAMDVNDSKVCDNEFVDGGMVGDFHIMLPLDGTGVKVNGVDYTAVITDAGRTYGYYWVNPK